MPIAPAGLHTSTKEPPAGDCYPQHATHTSFAAHPDSDRAAYSRSGAGCKPSDVSRVPTLGSRRRSSRSSKFQRRFKQQFDGQNTAGFNHPERVVTSDINQGRSAGTSIRYGSIWLSRSHRFCCVGSGCTAAPRSTPPLASRRFSVRGISSHSCPV